MILWSFWKESGDCAFVKDEPMVDMAERTIHRKWKAGVKLKE